MKTWIAKFEGVYCFLSNFYCANCEFDREIYPSSEHAYQAAKTLDRQERLLIQKCPSPGSAKRAGRNVTLRKNWDEIKNQIMLEIVRNKFTRHEDLKKDLIATGDAILIEGNTWHDDEWGICFCDSCNGRGHNMLGTILMQVREELKNK